jgi:RNA polymerase sigma-70 factor, ECF subfamily
VKSKPVPTVQTRRSSASALDALAETALLDRVRARDPVAFDELVRRYLRRAFSIAYHVMHHREDAEDLVQEAFITVLEQIERFDPERAFAPWFFRILVNRGLNARKSRTVRQTEPMPLDAAARGGTPDRVTERRDLQARVRLAVERLPERQGLILRLSELEGLTSVEIAEILDLSQGTVRWYLHEARNALKVTLAPLAGEIRE